MSNYLSPPLPPLAFEGLAHARFKRLQAVSPDDSLGKDTCPPSSATGERGLVQRGEV